MVVSLGCRYVHGDQSILESAGVNSLKDIDSLSAPAEVAGIPNLQRIPGEVDYLICTNVGKGAYVLGEQGANLIDPVSGLLKK